MYLGGFYLLDFSEQLLSLEVPTSGSPSEIDLAEMPKLKSQWNSIAKSKDIVVYNLWIGDIHINCRPFASFKSDAVILYFMCEKGNFKIEEDAGKLKISIVE